VKVQMICRLVKQKKVGLEKQRRRKGHSHAPSTGKVRRRLPHHFIRKLQTWGS
jgi:hypothetical protein